MTNTYGYARVSTKGQSLADQKQQLKDNGVENKNIYAEHYTGTTTHRPELESLLKKIDDNDTLIVTKLDRLARKTTEAIKLIEGLLDKHVTIKILNLGTVEDTPMGKMIVRTLASVAEMERDMIVERTQEGRKFARQHQPNYKEGRKTRLESDKKGFYQAVHEYKQTHSAKETADHFNESSASKKKVISARTVFRIEKAFKERQAQLDKEREERNSKK